MGKRRVSPCPPADHYAPTWWPDASRCRSRRAMRLLIGMIRRGGSSVTLLKGRDIARLKTFHYHRQLDEGMLERPALHFAALFAAGDEGHSISAASCRAVGWQCASRRWTAPHDQPWPAGRGRARRCAPAGRSNQPAEPRAGAILVEESE